MAVHFCTFRKFVRNAVSARSEERSKTPGAKPAPEAPGLKQRPTAGSCTGRRQRAPLRLRLRQRANPFEAETGSGDAEVYGFFSECCDCRSILVLEFWGRVRYTPYVTEGVSKLLSGLGLQAYARGH